MKKAKVLLNKPIIKFEKIDLIIFISIILFCSFFSFQKLGNIHSPNTFYCFKDKSLIIDINVGVERDLYCVNLLFSFTMI